MAANSIDLLQVFIPLEIEYGTNGTNIKWQPLEDGFTACFIYQNLAVLVLLCMNWWWGCHELIFMTAKHDKLSDLSVENMQIEAELLRSSGLAHNPNRAAAIFRHVTYVALSILRQI